METDAKNEGARFDARRLWAPTKSGEGARVGVVGDSGSGKTYAMTRIVAAYLDACPGAALCCDDKERSARFAGQERRNVADLKARPVAPEPRAIVFRGAPFEGVTVDPEEVAAFGWQLARANVPVLLVVDELERAARSGQWLPRSVWMQRSFVQGRAVGVSCLWGCQFPQQAPLEAFEQSSTLLVFKLDSVASSLLVRRGYLTHEQAATVAAFPGMEAAREKRGWFLAVTRGLGVTGPHRL